LLEATHRVLAIANPEERIKRTMVSAFLLGTDFGVEAVRTKDPSEPGRVLPAERNDNLALGDAGKETGHGREDGQNPADDRSGIDTCDRSSDVSSCRVRRGGGGERKSAPCQYQ
jgi:hypothetical protein